MKTQWKIGKPEREHSCFMVVNVYNHQKFSYHHYIAGYIDEYGDIMYLDDNGVGWDEVAIECWMDFPKIPKSILPILNKQMAKIK